MKLWRRLMTWTFSVGAIWNSSLAMATPDPDAKIGSVLLQKMARESLSSYEVLVYMKERANLEGINALKDRKVRAHLVYENLRDTALTSQKDLLALLDKEGIKYKSYYIGNLVAIEKASKELIRTLAAREDVMRVLSNHTFKAVSTAEGSRSHAQQSPAGVGLNIKRTGADRFWSTYGSRGEGIVIANQDTGFDWTHPALKNQYRGWDGTNANHDYNWHDAIHSGKSNKCGYNLRAPCDDNGHGTHTLGTSVGDDGKGNIIGVAPKAKWIGCRNMDAGMGKASTYIECFQFFLAPWPYGGNPAKDGRPDMAPDVINNSWGCPKSEGCEGDEFIPVLESLKAAGVMVVAAAGNDGSACSTITTGPAHHSDLALSVGAINHRNDSIASFSSRGPSAFDGKVSPSISAPGVSIRSSLPGGSYGEAMWSGTSMASPHVTGAVALLWSVDATLKGDIDATRALFESQADQKTSTQACGKLAGKNIPNNTFGHGILNIYKAAQKRLQ